MSNDQKTLLLLKPRGFCAGVVRAIDIVRIALEAFGPPIYVRKEIVHNSFVVEELQGKGAIFVDSVDEVPEGERVIYSAHGVSPEVRQASKDRRLRVIDATCPLVTKVHVEAVKFAKEGYSLILIGHRDHDEIIGTLGEAPDCISIVESPEDVERLAGQAKPPGGSWSSDQESSRTWRGTARAGGCPARGDRRAQYRICTVGTVRVAHPTHLEPGRGQRHHRSPAPQVPEHQRSTCAGYLLRHREPAGCREARRVRCRPAVGRGVREQL